ncbi:hypothetical protein S40293_07536 [Stachybotrys chartarum IBT 40293]|nr:hypothetical protein S40293_07536 [Stachybotrys chartarum IBT 40293]
MNVSNPSKSVVAAADDVMMQDSDDASIQWAEGYSMLCEDDHHNDVDHGVDHLVNSMFGSSNDGHGMSDTLYNFESPISSLDTSLMHTPGLSPVSLGDNAHDSDLSRASFSGHKKQLSQHSLTSSVANGIPNIMSREASPARPPSYKSEMPTMCPSTLLNSIQPQLPTRPMAAGKANNIWSGQFDMTNATPFIKNDESLNPVFSLPPQPPMSNRVLHVFASRQDGSIEPVGRSRVETQIFVKMILSPLPQGVTKLHLPSHTISKPKLLANPAPVRAPDTLELFVTLVCTSAMQLPGARQRALERAAMQTQDYLPDLDSEENSPQNGGDVRICSGCISRERKRAGRKKNKKPEEDKVWMQGEERRVVVFNTSEMKEWQPFTPLVDKTGQPVPIPADGSMQVGAPMRIACYCRHHGEKMGFNVIFTIKDWQDRVVAQAMSDSIMITDDHKTHHPTVSVPAGPNSQASPDDAEAVPPPMLGNFRIPPQSIDLSTVPRCTQALVPIMTPSTVPPTAPASVAPSRVISRVASPMLGEPTAKKRKASGCSEQNSLALTRIDTSAQSSSHALGSQSSTATSPFSPSHVPMAQLEHRLRQQNFSGLSTPNASEQQPFFSHGRTGSVDSLAMTQAFSAPTSAHPSRAPSPSRLTSTLAPTSHNQLTPMMPDAFQGLGNMGGDQPPMIHKIVPSEGPRAGGIEVTVLGTKFFQGLEVWFGDQKATMTTFWGESSLVCLLPPLPDTGIVPVAFRPSAPDYLSNFTNAMQPAIFKYVEDSRDRLVRLALSMLSSNFGNQIFDRFDLSDLMLSP